VAGAKTHRNLKHEVPSVVQPRLLTVKEAAVYLASSPWFIRSLVWDRKLPKLKLGNRLVFDRIDLDRFVDILKQQTEISG
jgi:excisionase family DNA binding protein